MFHSTATELQISILLGAGWYDAFLESKTWVSIEIWSHLKDDLFSPLPNEKYLGSQVHFWLLFLFFESDLYLLVLPSRGFQPVEHTGFVFIYFCTSMF